MVTSHATGCRPTSLVIYPQSYRTVKPSMIDSVKRASDSVFCHATVMRDFIPTRFVALTVLVVVRVDYRCPLVLNKAYL